MSVSFRLDPSDSNLNGGPVAVTVLVPCRCRCRTCDKCGPALGWRVRQNLLYKSSMFRRPALLTLTVDRSHFKQPEDAHRSITESSYIPRLMRLLGVRLWFWVLEFQSKSGAGWPHWHLLIDLDGVPGGRIDLARAWHLWRDVWKLGGLDLDVRQPFTGSQHAVYYVTKYLTKMPEAFPPWVLLRERTIRFVGGCKGLGSLTGQPPRDAPPPPPAGQLDLPFRKPRTVLIWRMAGCCWRGSVFSVVGDGSEGSLSEFDWAWRGVIDASPEDVFEMACAGMISARVAPIDLAEREVFALLDTSVGGLVSALRKLPAELADREVGYSGVREELQWDRAADLLDRHGNFWGSP